MNQIPKLFIPRKASRMILGLRVLACDETVVAPVRPSLFVLLAPGLAVVGHVAGCCRVGLKHNAEVDEELAVLDKLELADFVEWEEIAVVFVEGSSVVVVVLVLDGRAKTTVVLIDTPIGCAGTGTKAKEYSPDGSG